MIDLPVLTAKTIGLFYLMDIHRKKFTPVKNDEYD